ncbi:hypothetical protein CDAR_473751 [Caerostris darwini]|uniref:Uncharacterized protein n=1 Tax=Caerostris darwini TaxID=1538125 RepID=A0AAV4SEX3_9ARAC|nr:hypothetical protein CDAR_473751 [Caerostris darwini]
MTSRYSRLPSFSNSAGGLSGLRNLSFLAPTYTREVLGLASYVPFEQDYPRSETKCVIHWPLWFQNYIKAGDITSSNPDSDLSFQANRNLTHCTVQKEDLQLSMRNHRSPLDVSSKASVKTTPSPVLPRSQY